MLMLFDYRMLIAIFDTSAVKKTASKSGTQKIFLFLRSETFFGTFSSTDRF